MSVFGTPNSQSLAGAHAAVNTPGSRPARKPPERAGNPARADDEFIAGAEQAGETEHTRRIARNDQEDAREDHQEHPAYSPKGRKREEQQRRFDTSG